MEKILAELSFRYGPFQVRIRGGNDTYVNPERM
jgi:hypothetical protein